MADKYEEVVEKIPAPERAIGPLAGIATRLDFLGPKVEGMEKKVGELEYALANLQLPEGAAMLLTIEQIPFAYNLAIAGTVGSGVKISEYAPFSGYIKQVMIHFPDGCNALVDVRVGHGTKQFCPKSGFLALNNATPIFPFNEGVADREEIWVEMRNGDGVNPHNISCTVFIEGVK